MKSNRLRRPLLALSTLLLAVPLAGPQVSAAATAAPTLYAYEPQDDGNCLAPCRQLNLWVEPGSGGVDAGTARLGLTDAGSGATVALPGSRVVGERLAGLAQPLPRFIYATPGLEVGHRYRADFSVLDNAGRQLKLDYEFLVDQVTVPRVAVSLPSQAASRLSVRRAGLRTTTEATFADLSLSIPQYPVHLSGSEHAGLGYAEQEVSLASATVTYLSGGVRRTASIAATGAAARQPRTVLQPVTVLDRSRTDYDVYALGGRYDAGSLSLDLPGDVTSASISMAPVLSLSIAGVVPGMQRVVPIQGYPSGVVDIGGPCPGLLNVTTEASCIGGDPVAVAAYLAGIAVADAFPIYASQSATATMIQVEAGMLQDIATQALNHGWTPHGQLVSGLMYYPQVCGVTTSSCQPVSPRVTLGSGSCRPECPPQIGSSMVLPPVFRQLDFSTGCGVSLACAERGLHGAVPTGQDDPNWCTNEIESNPGTMRETQCTNGMYIGYDTSTWLGQTFDGSAKCNWDSNNDCEYIDGASGWSNGGYSGGSQDGFQMDVGEQWTNATLDSTHWITTTLNQVENVDNYPQYSDPCSTSDGYTINGSDLGNQSHSEPSVVGTARLNFKFDEEDIIPDQYNNYCGFQTKGGRITNSWMLPNSNQSCGGSTTCDMIGVNYNQETVVCSWQWNPNVSVSPYPPAIAFGVAPNQSCSPQETDYYMNGYYTH